MKRVFFLQLKAMLHRSLVENSARRTKFGFTTKSQILQPTSTMCKSQFTASDKHDIIINFLYFLVKKRKLKHICIWKSYLRFITAYKSRMDGKDR